ncbi:MAG: YdcF family protein [Clostridia bacterium]|nr:YdcF family protein [Clostridia bacterium]
MTRKKVLKTALCILLALVLLGAVAIFAVDAYVRTSTSERIITAEQAELFTEADCILILGCKVKENGKPSDMLRDRLDVGLDLYARGVAPKLLMSGDHGQKEYDEVNVMKKYAVNAGVASEAIFMDHAGFSTYESLYRAKEIFACKKVVIVTQEYHLYRALYVAEALGLEAYGVKADLHTYGGQAMRDVREILARNKDFLSAVFKPSPTYLGEEIPIWANGDLTNDQEV